MDERQVVLGDQPVDQRLPGPVLDGRVPRAAQRASQQRVAHQGRDGAAQGAGVGRVVEQPGDPVLHQVQRSGQKGALRNGMAPTL